MWPHSWSLCAGSRVSSPDRSGGAVTDTLSTNEGSHVPCASRCQGNRVSGRRPAALVTNTPTSREEGEDVDRTPRERGDNRSHLRRPPPRGARPGFGQQRLTWRSFPAAGRSADFRSSVPDAPGPARGWRCAAHTIPREEGSRAHPNHRRAASSALDRAGHDRSDRPVRERTHRHRDPMTTDGFPEGAPEMRGTYRERPVPKLSRSGGTARRPQRALDAANIAPAGGHPILDVGQVTTGFTRSSGCSALTRTPLQGGRLWPPPPAARSVSSGCRPRTVLI